jgi:hypothetical protein
MKKIVRLTESELNRIVEKSVRRAINEGAVNESWKDVRNTVGAAAASIPLMYGGMVAYDKVHENDPEIDPQQQEINNDIKNGLGQHVLEPGGEADDIPNDTIDFNTARRGLQVNSRMIKGAVMESIKKLMNGRL